MNTNDLLSLVEDLEENVEDLEENLEPLLATALSVTTQKLPLLEKAKLYVLIVYSIESLLFSYLRLHGVQAKEHPVFRELTRVKQYFEKIKSAETGPAKPRENMSLNRGAAGRVIKHALAGNDRFDAERRERELREKLVAARKLKELEANMKGKPETEQTEDGTDSESSDEEISADADTPVDPSLHAIEDAMDDASNDESRYRERKRKVLDNTNKPEESSAKKKNRRERRT